MGLEFLEKYVGRDLKDNVRNEENGKGRVVLKTLRVQIEILLQAKNRGVCNVGPVEEGEEIENAQDWYHSQVDLGHELSLRSGRWQNGMFVLVLGGGMREVRIVEVAFRITVTDPIGVPVAARLLVCS